ncbi:MAG: ribosome biogenesis GTPase YlqF [Clostridia bacterium]|nr:ribosome biogenesis GTPase YlqF [Clostridia bacterium]
MGSNQNQIQWYPGHMAKARREIGDAVKQVDVVIELVDARIPKSSRNPILNEIIADKPRIIVLNKADLADKTENQKWINHFKTKNQVAIETNSNQGLGMKKVVDAAYELMREKLERKEKQGMVGASIKAMIVGIPNVGKSTFINKVAGKSTAETGNKPGVTKRNQWVRLNEKIQLLDTPGVLWPKFDDELTARHLAYIGTIKDAIMDIEELSLFLVEELLGENKDKLFERYKIDSDFEYEMPLEVLEEIGRKRGCLVKGGEIDYTKVANIIIDEFRTGKIGNITLESAPERK